MEGDWYCLFRAIGDQLEGDENKMLPVLQKNRSSIYLIIIFPIVTLSGIGQLFIG